MKLYDISVFIVGVLVFVLVVGIVSSKYYGPDNIVEEISEKIIEEETGIDLDLSPETEEG